MAELHYNPNPKDAFCLEAVDGKIYLWEGDPRKEIQVYDPTWESLEEFSIIPPFSHPSISLWGASSVFEKNIYVLTTHSSDVGSGSLVKFDTGSQSWELLAKHCPEAPMKKCGSAIVAYRDNLVVFGGLGIRNGPVQPGSEWLKWTEVDMLENPLAKGITNELHKFEICRGKWFPVESTGSRPPPCFNFSFTLISDTQALLVGGIRQHGHRTNNAYLLNLPNMHWSEANDNKEATIVLPARSSHAAACLHGSRPQLVVVGGVNCEGDVLRDVWMMDVPSGAWREVKVNVPSLQSRLWHCAAAFPLTPAIVEIVISGGATDSAKPNFTHLRFEKKNSDENVEWEVTDIADHHKLGSSERIRKKMAIKISHLSHETLQSRAEAEKMREEAEVMKAEGDAKLRDVEQLAQQSDRAYKEMLQEALDICSQRKEDLLHCAKDLEMSKNQAKIYKQVAEQVMNELCKCQQDARMRGEKTKNQCRCNARQSWRNDFGSGTADAAHHRDHWLVRRNEIAITDVKLGGGGWGEVWVAYFRGTRVAAKIQYVNLNPECYYSNFHREMEMASRIRHPNLVQFIGGCVDEEMVLLMELMPLSLHRHLSCTAPSIPPASFKLAVSMDVARALNYLHLMQPHPIIHRDISSSNVLLEPLPNQAWRAKVTDYGSVNLQRQLLTNNPGSPIYSAPEANFPSCQTTKMDVFSFGVLLIEICTGQVPFYPKRASLIISIRERFWLEAIYPCLQENMEKRPSMADIMNFLSPY